MAIDYSLYLVTGRTQIPEGMDYLYSLEEALTGGVTVVQIREKETETNEFLEIALASKQLCDKFNVPLLINDRIDIALAVGAHGVHLGQTDMPIEVARKLLPEGSIIGISVNSVLEARDAVKRGADYIGVGAVYGTKTKALTNPLVGVTGVGPILDVLVDTNVKAVAIGGIKESNLLRVLHGSTSVLGRTLDGVAVVSDIMASEDPQTKSKALRQILDSYKLDIRPYAFSDTITAENLLDSAVDLMNALLEQNPLVHQITNNVVATQSANITLALGASPLMATAPAEAADIAKIASACLINIGTLTPETREGMLRSGFECNKLRKPVVLDPVGVGASGFRQQTVHDLIELWQPSVIKGNAGELAAMVGSCEVLSKGVDSVGSGFRDPVTFVRNMARRQRCVIVLTGETDYISDGEVVVALANGDPLLGMITGSGCITGSCIAAYCGAATNGSKALVSPTTLVGAVTGVLALTVAAEVAARRKDVQGRGTFLPALIDKLSLLREETVRNAAKIKVYGPKASFDDEE
ncbi:thiamine biosynthetic bifunctional enzyme Thi4 [Cylindrobasidium torrendii FP15055 ss-10]|uniref:Thiamine biosynthetic bifunctional enzyme Thi4 n=1 Tax=Cylindrobasidium torrendii FP15055 ss-10 TaxID=1314674 RepID=A0A0D7B5F3_9AGAR|nr:thiamine biosynthetic bifunctional enzyme Thi4 [Cylindrobasidium torrendii FP15055 ss-10]